MSASWSVPASATSGIYIARLVREDGPAGASHMIFVVRDDDGGSEILFQTSDTTWQAYNRWGGNSLYWGDGPGGDEAPGRAYKVSYNRPFNTVEATPEDWVFHAEHSMVRWLEQNGYDVSYFTGVDTDRRGNEILEHKVFLSVGHDEYWSGPQRANVEAARDNATPVHLGFFSSNEVFWKTRWETSNDGTNTPYRTLVCYKETHADAKIDPLTSVWTGTWRDPRPINPEGPNPENALTGTAFMVNDNLGANIVVEVPAAEGQLRFWRDTPEVSTTPNVWTGPDETVGYEWDVDLDNGFRPAGLVRLSTTVASGVEVMQDGWGSSYAPGTATHHAVFHKRPNGALVFGSGTLQWAWGLDGDPYQGSQDPGPDMQQATVNLFADMGVQPATLKAGLQLASASTDIALPVSDITSPAPGATLPVNFPVVIHGTATDANPGLVGGVEVSVDGGATWHPASGRESWSYTFTPTVLGSYAVRSRAVDDSGNLETPGAGRTIVIEPDSVPPTVASTTPTSGATGVLAGANVTVTFSEVLNVTTINGTTFRLTRGGVLVPAVVTWSAETRTATLDPTAGLAYGETYTATVKGFPGGVTDLAGNPMAVDHVFSFTVEASPAVPPDPEGPGGPVLVITSLANPFSRYYTEILRAEGLNAFKAIDIAVLTGPVLATYDVAILGEMPLTAAQVTMLSSWVTAGGNLIAMRPDKQLAGLLGLTDESGTLPDAYLLAPGTGIVGQTIQFHGTADRYGLAAASPVAVPVATLYSNATTATANPAVTLRTVGGAGGQAAAFTFDLARSIVYTRQGNPAWAGDERDGSPVLRSDDLFFGAKAGDPQARLGRTSPRWPSPRPTSCSACSPTWS